MAEFDKGNIPNAVDIIVRNPKFSNWKVPSGILKKKMEELTYNIITIYDVILICMELHFKTLDPIEPYGFSNVGITFFI